MTSPTAGPSAVPVCRTAGLSHVRVAGAGVLAAGLVIVMAVVAMKGDVGALATISSFAAVGAVISWKRPDARVGWLLMVAGLLFGFSTVAFLSVEVVNASASPPPVAIFGAWLDEWSWIPMLTVFFVVLPMLLPDGRPSSPIFGRLLGLIVAAVAAWTVTAMFSARLADEIEATAPGIANPVGLLPLHDVENPPTRSYLEATFAASVVIAIASLVTRYRRSVGRERTQLRWIAVGTTATIVGFFTVARFAELLPFSMDWMFVVVMPLMPLSIGIAVLRYNLYDIDRLISRTVAYGAVTAVLVATYLTLVVVIRQVLPVHGDVPVAASTLAVAALFNPVRRSVQRLVDRRFNRARYDAARTVDAFAERLRIQFDVAALTKDVEAVVVETMQPTAMSLWLPTRSAAGNLARDVSVGRRPSAPAGDAHL